MLSSYYIYLLDIFILDEIDIQLVFKEELKEYFEFDVFRHVI